MNHAPPPSPDGFSIAALVTGLAGTGPVAFTLGAIGLHRTGNRRGRGLAIAGVALGGLQMLAAGVLVTTLGVGAVVADREVVVDDLAVGECFSTGEDGGLSGRVDRVDCTDRHEAEVVAITDLGAGEYPGASYLEGYADQLCAERATVAVQGAGLALDDFDYGYFYPLAENWTAGSHLVHCTVYGWDGYLVGSVGEGDARLSP